MWKIKHNQPVGQTRNRKGNQKINLEASEDEKKPYRRVKQNQF